MTPIECPSGFAFEPRKLGGRLFAQLAARTEIGSLGDVVQQCCAKITEPGPYALGRDGQVNWKRVVAGDLAVAFVRIRTISLPETYDGQVFKWTIKCRNIDCLDEDGRRTEYVWTTRIDDVPVVALSPDARDRVKAGNVFPGQLLDGRALTFKLPTDEDGPVIRKLLAESGIDRKNLTPDNAEEVLRPFLVAARVLSVAGCPDVAAARNAVLDADFLTLGDVARQINALDCGFDSFHAKCPGCGDEPELSLPITPQLLFSLSNAVKKATAGEAPPTKTQAQPSPAELGPSSAPASPG